MRNTNAQCVPFAATLALAALLTGSLAHAQNYPARPIQVIVPFAGGSASDVVTRILLEHAAKTI
jgi:tripartite-type tricarboxylate transporter receptor subunit TctC